MTENEEKMPIEEGLASKIYLLAFFKPCSGYEISDRIYGRDLRVVRDTIYRHAPEGYFIAISQDKRKHPKWLSNIDILVDKIGKEIRLFKSEQNVLKTVMTSRAFEYLIEKQLPDNLKDASINAVDLILTTLDTLFIISEEIQTLANRGKEHDMIMDYDNAIFNIQNDKKLMKYLQKTLKKLCKEKELPEEIIEDIPRIFVFSYAITQQYSGISEFGKKYHEMKLISQQISKLDD
jgi:hypothetical protein